MSTNIHIAAAENLLAGPVQQRNASLDVRGQQPAAHGVDDVLGKILQVHQLFALLFEFHALSPQGLREHTAQERHHEESQRVAQKPDTQIGLCRRRHGADRQLPGIDEHRHTAEQEQAQDGCDIRGAPGKKNGCDDNYEQVERIKIAVL